MTETTITAIQRVIVKRNDWSDEYKRRVPSTSTEWRVGTRVFSRLHRAIQHLGISVEDYYRQLREAGNDDMADLVWSHALPFHGIDATGEATSKPVAYGERAADATGKRCQPITRLSFSAHRGYYLSANA